MPCFGFPLGFNHEHRAGLITLGAAMTVSWVDSSFVAQALFDYVAACACGRIIPATLPNPLPSLSKVSVVIAGNPLKEFHQCMRFFFSLHAFAAERSRTLRTGKGATFTAFDVFQT